MITQDKIKYFLKKGFLLSPDVLYREIEEEIKEDIINLNSLAPPKEDDYKDIKEDYEDDWEKEDRSENTASKKNESAFKYARNLPITKENNPAETEPEAEENENKKNYPKNEIKNNIKKEDIIKYKDIEDRSITTGIYNSSPEKNSIEVLSSYSPKPKKYIVRDFVKLFSNRYKMISKLLKNRSELSSVRSISRIKESKEKGSISLIGLVYDIRKSKKGNTILLLEDPTGMILTVINNEKTDLAEKIKDVTMDEVIGLTGSTNGEIIFVDDIFFPDIPLNDIKRADDESYALFISDVHVGSKYFLKEKFENFIRWINCGAGNDKQKERASKVRYIFITGDSIDGVGIYPSQEKELVLNDVEKQYEKFADYLKKIPPHIQIVLCSGNHDSIQLAEPQSPPMEKFAKSLYEIPNLTLVSNPALIRFHHSENFEGFLTLMYHGYSFDYYVRNIDNIRQQGGYKRADLIMKFLLQKRHLAPTYTSTQYVIDEDIDPLVIREVPDFFVSGHIHYSIASNYKNVTLISSSCWQGTTSFQEKMGHTPEPARAPLINLKTREITILRF